MVSMIVGQAYDIDGFKAPSLFFYGDLGALSAIDEQVASLASNHQGSEPTVGQRHHASGPQQTNI
jgi:hypothetical protein